MAFALFIVFIFAIYNVNDLVVYESLKNVFIKFMTRLLYMIPQKHLYFLKYTGTDTL